jgi:hypothetical protein
MKPTRCLFLFLAMALFFCTANGLKGQVVVGQGITGNLSWTITVYDDFMLLAITGSGEMPDYDTVNGHNPAPWVSSLSRPYISRVIIEEGITSIGRNAFGNCSGLHTITIPATVKSIGPAAFSESGFTSIIIPNGVLSVGNGAFTNCSKLTSVSLPQSLTSIGGSVFEGCTSLMAIHVVVGNQYYSSLDGVLYDKDQTKLITWPIGKEKEVFMAPNTVTTIGEYAFRACLHLSSVVLPQSVKTIEVEGLARNKLKSVIIAPSVTTLGIRAFVDCFDLTDMVVLWDTPSAVDLGMDLFWRVKTNDVTLHIPEGTTAAYRAVEPWKDFRLTESHDYLAALTAGEGGLLPRFSSLVHTYRMCVPRSVDRIQLTATPLFDGTVSGDGLKTVNLGENTFEITAALQGRTGRYTAIIHRLRETYSAVLDTHSPQYTQAEFEAPSVGTVTLNVISGYNLYYTLQTGGFSGNLPLRFGVGNGVSCERTVAVQPNHVYKITLNVPVQHSPGSVSAVTTYDNFGNPDKTYIEYNDYNEWNIDLSEGRNLMHISGITLSGRPASASISDIRPDGGSTSIAPAEGASLQIYPNPVSESFRIEGASYPAQLTITDLNGRTVLRKNSQVDEPVSIRHLPRGIYLININGKTSKIIKN